MCSLGRGWVPFYCKGNNYVWWSYLLKCIYMCVMWAAKRWNEVDSILKPVFFFMFHIIIAKFILFWGNDVCPTACGLMGLILCLLPHLPLLSVAREVSGWGLTYHITYDVNNNHWPRDGNKNFFWYLTYRCWRGE